MSTGSELMYTNHKTNDNEYMTPKHNETPMTPIGGRDNAIILPEINLDENVDNKN